jgi:hypothetical protein
MGKITEDMTRLHEEILVMRNARRSLIVDLKDGARRLSSTVSGVRGELRSRTGFIVNEARSEREAFTAGLKESVLIARNQIKQELAGAHRAWLGGSSKIKKNVVAKHAKKQGNKAAADENFEEKRIENERKRLAVLKQKHEEERKRKAAKEKLEIGRKRVELKRLKKQEEKLLHKADARRGNIKLSQKKSGKKKVKK